MTSRRAFQPQPFCDSVSVIFKQASGTVRCDTKYNNKRKGYLISPSV